VAGPAFAALSGRSHAGAPRIDWDETSRLFAAERWYWVATTSDQGRPHLRPVLAVWVGERIYSTTSPAAARAPDVDIVIEGTTAWIEDRQQLRRVGDAYQDKCGWLVTADNAFDAPYGAPTAGHPHTGSTNSPPPSPTPSEQATTSENAPPDNVSTHKLSRVLCGRTGWTGARWLVIFPRTSAAGTPAFAQSIFGCTGRIFCQASTASPISGSTGLVNGLPVLWVGTSSRQTARDRADQLERVELHAG